MTIATAILLVIAIWIVWRALSAIVGGFKETLGSDAGAHHDRFDDRDVGEVEAAWWEAMASLRPLHAELQIQYRDGRGAITQRRITLRDFSIEGSGALIGHCHLRNGQRSFRLDRVIRCVDVEGGEVIGDLRAWLTQRYDSSPERGWELVLHEHLPVVRALLYLGKADGQFSAKERDIVVGLCRTLVARDDLERPQFNDAIRSMSTPSRVAFHRICGELAKHPRAADILAAAEAIVATQKTVTAAEAEALDYINRRLAKPAPVAAAPIPQ
jgi:hypothetical protein